MAHHSMTNFYFYNMDSHRFLSYYGDQDLQMTNKFCHTSPAPFAPYTPSYQEPAFISGGDFDDDTPTNYASEGKAPEKDFYSDSIPAQDLTNFQGYGQLIHDVAGFASKDFHEFDIYKLPPARESSNLSAIQQMLEEELDSPSPLSRPDPVPEQEDTDDCVLDRQMENISPDEGVTTKRRRITRKTKNAQPDCLQGLHVCQVCGRRFGSKGNLQNHMRRHTGEKPYGCTTCGKRFTQISSLKSHARVHTGERPYQCQVCHRSFADYSTCAKHERIHSGERPYSCDICGKSFTQSGNMLRHKKSHAK